MPRVWALVECSLRLLAQESSGAAEAPDTVRSRVAAGALLVTLLGLIGIVMVILLLRSWRRYNDRLRGEPREKRQDEDLWQAAGQRYASQPADEDDLEDDDPDIDDDDPHNRDDEDDRRHG